MNEKEFNSQISTTIEQSKRLLDLGLKPETADCQYAALVIDWKGNPISSPKWRFYDHNKGFIVQNFERMERIPAWSLHRLIEILDIWCLDLDFHNFDNAYEQVISYFEERVKGGFLNKEYLKQ